MSRHTQEFWICLFKSHFLLESGRYDIFEIVMVSKILHFYIFCFLYGQYEFLNFFSNFRSQHRHTSFLPKYWYIMDIHHKKWKVSVLMLASHFSHTPKKQNSQNWSYFERNYLEKPTSAYRSFWFFWLSIT